MTAVTSMGIDNNLPKSLSGLSAGPKRLVGLRAFVESEIILLWQKVSPLIS